MESIVITFRYMEMEDIEAVVDFINEHDEDDGEEAHRDYIENGVGGQYVMLLDDVVIGVTGAKELDDCIGSLKLSWTYVAKKYRNLGYGKQLLQHILSELKEYNARKVFVYVSDYKDDSGNNIYAGALHLYQSLGFEVELQIKDYYDEDESLTVLGLVLQDKPENTLPIKPESPKLKFNNLIHIAETESAFNFGWQPKIFGKHFSVHDLETGLDAARNNDASVVLVSFPSNYQNVKELMLDVGFKQAGQLKDYYEIGVSEDHYVYYL